MSSYLPFARKYRPKNFSELIGQEVLTKTLSYCISNKKLAGSILLTGIRGVGKTSSARIIAKTINCTSPKFKNINVIIPCEICKNCEDFIQNNHPDIIEIDAASRTGVDDIREIIESSEYKPLLGEYKIFIIDEVHMLSKSAFNALLKLIEEPPLHVIFIFATTEVHKIPLTVISRCQRYDLRRLSSEEIILLLRKIAKDENVKFEEEALKIIALKSEGSARDAILVFDQASSYVHAPFLSPLPNLSEDNHYVTAELVNKMLGLVQVSTILKLVQLIIANSPQKATKLIEEIYISSSNLEFFIVQVADFIAELAKEKVMSGFNNPLYKNYQTEITDILIGMSISRLSILWQIFNKGVQEVKSSHNELITVEMLVIKAIYSCNMPKIEEIIEEENKLTQEHNRSTSADFNKVISNKSIKTEIDIPTEYFDFLKYCHELGEMDLYYFLLNEVEVRKFANPVIEIATSIKATCEKALKNMLHNWSNADWQIVISKQDKITSVKERLLEKVKISEDFAIIKNNFPNANISDILFKS